MPSTPIGLQVLFFCLAFGEACSCKRRRLEFCLWVNLRPGRKPWTLAMNTVAFPGHPCSLWLRFCGLTGLAQLIQIATQAFCFSGLLCSSEILL